LHRRTLALGVALSAGLALAITPATSKALTLYGVESAKFRWATTYGPVSYYRVYVSTNGGAPIHYRATGNEAVVQARFGQTISVSVAAVSDSSGNFVQGPMSLPSEDVLFLERSGSNPGPDPEPTTQPDPEPTPQSDPEPTPGTGPEPDPQARTTPSDFDGDGRSDILIQNGTTGELRVWSMDGSQILSDDPLMTGPAVPVVSVGDFDGDGMADVLYFLDDSRTLAFYRSANGALNLPLDPGWHVESSGDYDGNGYADLLVRNTNTSEMAIWLLTGWGLEVVPIFSVGQSSQIRTGDFNGDGTDDLVMSDSTGEAMDIVLMDNGVATSIDAVDGAAAGWSIAGVGDLNADGRDDVVFRHMQGSVYAWLMEGSEVVDSGSLGTADTTWEIVGLVDVDGDGDQDLIWHNEGGRTRVKFLDGLALLSYELITAIDENWVVVNPN
jgi:hypothetical protein